MKNSILSFSLSLILVSLILASFIYEGKSQKFSFSYKDTPEAWSVTVQYPAEQTPNLTHYIDSCLKLEAQNDATFRIRSKSGSFFLSADKQKNSPEALAWIKSISSGIKDVIHP